jgi:hypothetical protein
MDQQMCVPEFEYLLSTSVISQYIYPLAWGETTNEFYAIEYYLNIARIVIHTYGIVVYCPAYLEVFFGPMFSSSPINILIFSII